MTRTEQFDANVKEPLLQLNNEVENLDLANLDDAQRLELARAKEVLTYVLNYINLLDPDLLPKTFYNQIITKTQTWNKTVPHLNQVLDDILFYLASYSSIYIPKNQASSTIAEMVKSYGNTIKQSLQEINFGKVKKDAKAIERYESELLSADDSIQSKVANYQSQIQTWFDEIKKFRNNFFEKQDGKDISLQTEINNARNDINKALGDIKKDEDEFSQTKEKLDEFYYKIYGNDTVKGLQKELDERREQLDKYKIQLENYEKEQREIIGALVSDATDEKLSKSYREAKDSYDTPIKIWNGVFIGSMAIIAIIASLSILGILLPTIDFNDHNSTSNQITSRLLLCIALSWLAIFATRRRNEIKRLQEEYRYKEATAKSYFNYNQRIKDIQDEKERDDLRTALIERLIEMTAQNPNKALDKTKKENVPMFELLNQIAKLPSEAREFLKGIIAIVKSSEKGAK